MADRYQGRPFPASGGYDHRDDPNPPARPESDPLAELARLIGQNDPFANTSRANPSSAPRSAPRGSYQAPDADHDDPPPPSPPPWMQRATRHEPPAPSYPAPSEPEQDYAEEDYPEQNYSEQHGAEQDYPSSQHPLRRYPPHQPEPEPEYEPLPAFTEAEHQSLDPSRYDEALYGQFEAEGHEGQHDSAYPEDPYAYQEEYEGEEPVEKRRSGLSMVLALVALAVVGTGGAFAYRTFAGSSRSGEPPIIKADTSPTKIIPAQDSISKQPDRLPAGDGSEKIVPREEAPVDVNANTRAGGPRMVFPPLNQNANPPSPSSVATNTPPPLTAANGTMPNNQPRSIKTFTVHGDQADGTPAPAAPSARAPATRSVSPAAANANANANAPLSLSPQGAPSPAAPATRMATNTPEPVAPSAGTGGYLVQVSSQTSEADAQASYRVLQSKYPSVLGAQSVLIKRVDVNKLGIRYRAFAGPFSSQEQATQLCNSLKAAGGPQCLIQRN